MRLTSSVKREMKAVTLCGQEGLSLCPQAVYGACYLR